MQPYWTQEEQQYLSEIIQGFEGSLVDNLEQIWEEFHTSPKAPPIAMRRTKQALRSRLYDMVRQGYGGKLTIKQHVEKVKRQRLVGIARQDIEQQPKPSPRPLLLDGGINPLYGFSPQDAIKRLMLVIEDAQLEGRVFRGETSDGTVYLIKIVRDNGEREK